MKENRNVTRFEEFNLAELKELAAAIVREIEQRTEAQQQAAMQEIRKAMMAYCQEFGAITFCVDGVDWVADAKYMTFDLDTITIDM